MSESTLYREITDEERLTWPASRYTTISAVPVEPDQFQRVTQAGGMGSWRCNTCGTDCRADGPGCDGSDYDFTPSYWPDHRGEYMLIPIAGIEGDDDAV